MAEDGRRVIGIGQIRLHQAGTRELASLVVVPELQGQGVGRALVEALLAREQGPVFLFCAARLVGFYQRFGFTVVRGSAAPCDLWLLWLGAGVISAGAALLGRPGVVMMRRT